MQFKVPSRNRMRMWKIILLSVLMAGCKAHAHRLVTHDTYLSPTGLVFLKEDDVLVTGDSWTIVLVINATQHFKDAQNLKKGLIEMEEIMMKTNLTNRMYEEELIRLRSIVDNLLKVNEALTDMLGQGTAKRFIGDLGRALFGAASNEEVRLLSQRVVDLQYRVAGKESFEKDQMSITKTLNRKVEENAIKLANLINRVYQVIREYELEIAKDYDISKKIILQMQQSTNLSICFRLFESISLHSLISANKLQAGLEMAAQGKLSFSLISPQELKEELVKISSLLPFGLKLISGLRIEDMYKYREVAEMIAIAQNDLIMLSVRIPLLSEDRGFDLYRIHSVPMIDIDSGTITRIEPDGDYFLVSNNRQFYGLLSYEDLQQCSGNSPKICPSIFPLTNKYVPTCISSIYFKDIDSINEYCKRKILVKPHRPIWLVDKKNRGWIYSVAKLTKTTLHCDLKKTIDIELIGTNILANVSHCTILGQDFKLFRTSERIPNSNGTFSLLSAKPIGPALDKAITEQLSNTLAFDNAVEELRKEGLVNEGQGNSEEVYLNMLIAKMDTPSKSWRLIVLPAFVAIIISVACAYLILYYDKNHVGRINIPKKKRNRDKVKVEDMAAGEPLRK